MYHQYDTVVYPKDVSDTVTAVYPKDIKTSKPLYKRAAKSVGVLFGLSSDTVFLSPFEMGKFGLQVYLEEYKQMFCSNSIAQQTNLQTIVEEIVHIFSCLYIPFTFDQTSSIVPRKLDMKFIEVGLHKYVTNHCNSL